MSKHKRTQEERRAAILAAIHAGPNGMLSADSIAAKLGYRPVRSGRLAVSSTLRSLQADGLVGRIPPADQWDHADYFLSQAGKEHVAKAGGSHEE